MNDRLIFGPRTSRDACFDQAINFSYVSTIEKVFRHDFEYGRKFLSVAEAADRMSIKLGLSDYLKFSAIGWISGDTVDFGLELDENGVDILIIPNALPFAGRSLVDNIDEEDTNDGFSTND